MRKILLAGFVVALLAAGWCPQAEACKGFQARHQRRVERRQSGRGLARVLPRNW